MFECTACNARVRLPLSKAVKSVTCRRCGDVYFIEGERVFTAHPTTIMAPIDAEGGRFMVSKWMPTYTRPVRVGAYECRFRDIEPRILTLRWNGGWFVDPDSGKRVQMRTFLSWRGRRG